MPRLTPTQLLDMQVTVSENSPTQFKDMGIRLTQDAKTQSEPYQGMEWQLQRCVENYLQAKNLPYLHIRKAKGNKAGWPDLTILMPNGKTVYIELKVKGGRTTHEQREFIKQARIYGHNVHICQNIEQVIKIVKEAE